MTRIFDHLILFFAIFILLPSGLIAQENTDKEYAFAVTDIVGLEELQREFAAFQKLLVEKTGVKIKLFPVTSRTVVVEAFRSKKLDFALTGPSEYVILSSKTNAIPVVGLTRPDYYSIIVTKSDSGISTLEDLKGKKIAFGDYGSTSYHLAPLQIIADSGLNPVDDVRGINLSKLVAWKSFVRGKVDAIGMNQSRFELFKSKETLTDESYKVIAKGPDLPNDLIVAANGVPKEIITKIQTAFTEHSEELLKAMLTGQRNAKYQEMSFVTNMKDSDYDYIRKMYKTAGYAEFAKKYTGNS